MADGGYEVFEFHIGLSNGQLSAAIVLVFLAAILRGFTGFGFSALAVTTLSLFIAPKFVVPVIFILEICASLHLLPGVFKRIDWVLLAKLSFGVVVCTPVGVALLAHLSEDTMRLVLCTLVLALAALLMFGAEQKRPRPLLPVGTGLVAGFANGAAAIGGLPVVLMMLYTGLSAVAARSTLIAFFAFTDVYGLVWVRQNNLLTPQVISLAIAFLVPMVLGIALGSRLFGRARNSNYRRLTLGLLIAMSTLGLARSALELI